MAIYAMMSGNSVSNVIVTDNKEECDTSLGCVLIEITPENPAGTGYTYDETTGKFIAPIIEEITDGNA